MTLKLWKWSGQGLHPFEDEHFPFCEDGGAYWCGLGGHAFMANETGVKNWCHVDDWPGRHITECVCYLAD